MFGQIIKLAKGEVTTAHSAINATATSAVIKTNMHNAALLSCDITGTGAWTMKLQGAITSDGTYMDLYDSNGNLMSTGSITADRMQLFVGLPEFIKVVATEDTDGATMTVKVQPISV